MAGSPGGSWESEPWGASPDVLNYGRSLGAQLPPTVSTDWVPGTVDGKHGDDHLCPHGAGMSPQVVGDERLRCSTSPRMGSSYGGLGSQELPRSFLLPSWPIPVSSSRLPSMLTGTGRKHTH